jgi:hypothetical protein
MKIKEITLRENYKVTKSDPQTGMELTDISNPNGIKMIVPPEQFGSVQANPQDPNKFIMDPSAVASTPNEQPEPAQQQQ